MPKILDLISKKIIEEYNKKEYEQNQKRVANERSVEYQFVFRCLSFCAPERILDVGTGKTALPALIDNCGYRVTAIDNIKDYWDEGYFNKHYHVINDDITNTKIVEKFDLITCISVLEHVEDHEKALNSMVKLLKSNGYLILTFPYNEKNFSPNIYEHPRAGYGQNAKYICKVYSRKELEKWIKKFELEIISQEYWQIFNGEIWTEGGRLKEYRNVEGNDRHQLSCILLRRK